MKLAEPPIDEMVRRIVERLHPRRVVLFGSHARGTARPDSDVDLMVEVESEADRLRWYTEATPMTGLDWSIDVLLLTTTEVADHRNDPGRVMYTIAREGLEVYVDPQRDDRRVLREVPAIPPSSFDFARLADDDLECCEQLAKAAYPRWGIICFHAQQAAEKYLKAIVVFHGVVPERTHDLRKLLASCRALGRPLLSLDSETDLLTKYAGEGRYGTGRRTQADGERAVAAASCIAAAARLVLSLR